MEREHIYQLAYSSVAVEQMSRAALDLMVQEAVISNSSHDVTGTLMASDGFFIQWIEGPKHHVRDLFERILKDPRHHCIVKLMEEELFTNRLFPEWSMRLSERQEMLDILEAAHLSAVEKGSEWETAIQMLRTLLAQGADHTGSATGPITPPFSQKPASTD